MPKAKRPLVVVTRKLPDSVETRMRELFGYDASELAGLNAVQLYRDPADREHIRQHLRERRRAIHFAEQPRE